VQQELLKMQPNLELVAIARTLSPGDITMLDTYAARVSDVVWRLDQEKLLDAIENGRQLVSFTDWLRANSSPAWPDVVSQFLSDMETRTSVLQSTGTARMIKCTDVALATKIANDPETGRFCVLAGQRNLVVPIELENRFRTALRKFGYCLPKAGS
jgi:23S rRNA U2552 (ribose-2'-O)-methylase RlmE/FtsJ